MVLRRSDLGYAVPVVGLSDRPKTTDYAYPETRSRNMTETA